MIEELTQIWKIRLNTRQNLFGDLSPISLKTLLDDFEEMFLALFVQMNAVSFEILHGSRESIKNSDVRYCRKLLLHLLRDGF